jgi:tRNA(Ile)-lysidine synthase
VLRSHGKRPKSDIEAAARDMRYRLMGEWCRTRAVDALFLAHTEEDQAETFLLRLARGSGVDGLSAMQPRSAFPLAGFDRPALYRPLLGMGRAELRKFLSARDQPWLEDPMNQDVRFARTKLRAILPLLEAAGLSVPRIADAAAHLARAREALEAATAALSATAVYFAEAGYALLDASAITSCPREIGLRLLARVLMAVSGENYRPRFEKLEQLLDAIAGAKLSGGRTLHGCRIAPAPKAWRHYGAATLLVTREARAAARAPDVVLAPGTDAVWDGRFRVALATDATKPSRLHVTALGHRPELAEALAHVPAEARAGLPVVMRGETLFIVPHAAGVLNSGPVRVEFLARSQSGEQIRVTSR